MKIEKFATCKVQSMIQVFSVKYAEIHRQIVEVYGESAISKGNVRKVRRSKRQD
jgi:hypothetical protein